MLSMMIAGSIFSSSYGMFDDINSNGLQFSFEENCDEWNDIKRYLATLQLYDCSRDERVMVSDKLIIEALFQTRFLFRKLSQPSEEARELVQRSPLVRSAEDMNFVTELYSNDFAHLSRSCCERSIVGRFQTAKETVNALGENQLLTKYQKDIQRALEKLMPYTKASDKECVLISEKIVRANRYYLNEKNDWTKGSYKSFLLEKSQEYAVGMSFPEHYACERLNLIFAMIDDALEKRLEMDDEDCDDQLFRQKAVKKIYNIVAECDALCSFSLQKIWG